MCTNQDSTPLDKLAGKTLAGPIAEGDELCVAYPEVCPNATTFALDTPDDDMETMTVTRGGLARLLRIIRMVQEVAMDAVCRDSDPRTLSVQETAKLLNWTTGVWCEQDLVVSGLICDDAGTPAIHPNPEIAEQFPERIGKAWAEMFDAAKDDPVPGGRLEVQRGEG